MNVEAVREQLDGRQSLRPWMMAWGTINAVLLVAIALVWPSVDQHRSDIHAMDREARSLTKEATRAHAALERAQRRAARVSDADLIASTRRRQAQLRELRVALKTTEVRRDLGRESLAAVRRSAPTVKALLRRQLLSLEHATNEAADHAGPRTRAATRAKDRLRQLRGELRRKPTKHWSVLRQELEARIAAARRAGIPIDGTARIVTVKQKRRLQQKPFAGRIAQEGAQQFIRFGIHHVGEGDLHAVWRGARIVALIRVLGLDRERGHWEYYFERVHGEKTTAGDLVNGVPYDTRPPVLGRDLRTPSLTRPTPTQHFWGRDTYAWEGK